MFTDHTFACRLRTIGKSYDPYDGLAGKYPGENLIRSSDTVDEYWSNGTKTFLSRMDATPSCPLPHDNMQSLNHFPGSGGAVDTNVHHMVEPNEFARQSPRGSQPRLKNDESGQNEVRNSILAGSIAGMASCVLFHPLDVVRTKIQATTSVAARIPGNNASAILSSATNASRSRGITSATGPIAAISYTFRSSGLRGLYTGLSLPLAAQALYKSTVFTTNKISRTLLVDWKTTEQMKTGVFTPYRLTIVDYFICGAISGAINASLFVTPVEFVRNQLIEQHTRIGKVETYTNKGMKSVTGEFMKGPVDVIRRTLNTEGFLGLWRGAGVTILRDSIGCGSFFVAFELGQKYIPSVTGLKRESTTNTVCSGLMAGIGYWLFSLPLDSLKTLVQTGKVSSAPETVSVLIKRDGFMRTWQQLYRGWQLAFGRGAPSASVSVLTYASAYQLFNNFLD